MDAKSATDHSFASKTDYAKIKHISGTVNWSDFGPWTGGRGGFFGGDKAGTNEAFASLMEAMYEIGKVEANVSSALNLDIF